MRSTTLTMHCDEQYTFVRHFARGGKNNAFTPCVPPHLPCTVMSSILSFGTSHGEAAYTYMTVYTASERVHDKDAPTKVNLLSHVLVLELCTVRNALCSSSSTFCKFFNGALICVMPCRHAEEVRETLTRPAYVLTLYS